jgi:PQQ enzyme repeat
LERLGRRLSAASLPASGDGAAHRGRRADVNRAYAQPTVVGGRLFFGGTNSKVYSLDARTGCVIWVFEAGAPVRSAISIGIDARGAYFQIDAVGAVSQTKLDVNSVAVECCRRRQVGCAKALHPALAPDRNVKRSAPLNRMRSPPPARARAVLGVSVKVKSLASKRYAPSKSRLHANRVPENSSEKIEMVPNAITLEVVPRATRRATAAVPLGFSGVPRASRS